MLLGWLPPALVLAGMLTIYSRRIQRIEKLTSLPTWSSASPVLAANSATGYRDDQRTVVWPENSARLKNEIEKLQLLTADTARWTHRISGAQIESYGLYINSVSFVLFAGISAALLLYICGRRPAQLFPVLLSAFPISRLFAPGRLATIELFSGLLPGKTAPISLRAWFHQDGFSSPLLATTLPLVLLLPLAGKAVRERRRSQYFAFAFSVAAVAAATWRVSLFGLAELILFSAVAIAAADRAQWVTLDSPARQHRISHRGNFWWLTMLTLVPSWVLLANTLPTHKEGEFTPSEWHASIDRDLAHWLASREPHSVVLASPTVSDDLAYFGSLGTLVSSTEKLQNSNSLLRICEATTLEEAQRLIEAYHVKFLVFPSWDSFFRDRDQQNPHAFIEQLHRWNLPPWLRPLPYLLPALPGQLEIHVIIFSVVAEQDEPTATANLTEYFLETGAIDRARALRPTLDRFPTDLAALAAELQLQLAENPNAISRETINSVVDAVRDQADQGLSPDQRIRVALMLARFGPDDLARSTVIQCADALTSADVLALTPRTLLRFIALCHYYKHPIANSAVETFAWNLLPADVRAKVESR